MSIRKPKSCNLKSKSLFAALSLFALMNFGTCAAETIHVTGSGNTERMAIHNALRLAVEQKFGAVVNSKTFVKDKMLAADENSVDSNGFVTRYKIVSSRVVNGIYIVELDAELDDKISSRLTELEKKSLVDVNADNPRIAVVAFDSSGRRCTAVENEIVSALKRQGFTRTVDIAQAADYLVVADIKFFSDNEVNVASRMIQCNTGEIIFAGTSSGGGGFFSLDDALVLAGRRAGYDLSLAAIKFAAQVENHLTLMITEETFERLGGTLSGVCERIKNISGVNDIFTRKLDASLELDVDFDGTTADFAQMLEAAAIKILEARAGYIKI